MNHMLTTVATAIVAVGTIATATAGAAPQWQALLVAAIESSAAGECPAELMEDSLRAKCIQDQAAAFPELFAQMGRVRAADFVKVEPSRGGDVEIYRVTFERGEMTGYITAAADGKKITMLWLSDPVPNTSNGRS
jgi:hypothetical protein